MFDHAVQKCWFSIVNTSEPSWRQTGQLGATLSHALTAEESPAVQQ